MAKKAATFRLSSDTLDLIEKLKALEKFDQRTAAYLIELAIKLLAEREGIPLPPRKP